MSSDNESKFSSGVPRARARFLTQAVQLEESDVPGVVSTGVLLTTLLVVGAIVWASFTPLNEVSNTPGEVMPAGHVHKVQHLEGGIVANLHVRDGDEVSQGSPLISMAPSATRSELEQLDSRRADLSMTLERVNALLGLREPDFSAFEDRFPKLATRQSQLYRDQVANTKQRGEVTQARISQRQSAFDNATGQLRASEEEIGLLQELKNMRSTLAERHVVSRVDLLNSGVRLAEALRLRRELQGNVATAQRGIEEAKAAALEVTAQNREALSTQANEVSAELAEVEQTRLRIEDRLQRLTVTAPVDGIVKGLSINTIGSVIEPGQVLLELVPTTARLMVESRLSTKDVGHVHVGQPVDIKVTSFDAIRYGSISGTLRRISASTFLDADGLPYYRAEIDLARAYLGHDANRHRILPGMTVQADIITGSKTVLDYIMKPIYRGFQSAFRER
ncbi:MAG: HlyD family type I secretion periplasmic adaptor subunit [Gammaproteobacteria bacterium]|nr:HlyD family type I secretion periplasmic adaptor subunit [Gammaproteobacteria bacterium]